MNSPRKILVVDDDSMVRDLLARALPTFGFQPIVVSDGAAALAALETHPDIAAIVLDWMMPGMSGLEVMEDILARDTPAPVLMLSAKSRKQDVLSAIQAGVRDYMTKPVHLGQLVLRLTSLIERHAAETGNTQPHETYLGYSARCHLVIVDISATGVCLESTFAMPRDAVVFLSSAEITERLGLPPEYDFAVRVANCTPVGKRFRIGAQFIGLAPEVGERLRAACQAAGGFRAKG